MKRETTSSSEELLSWGLTPKPNNQTTLSLTWRPEQLPKPPSGQLTLPFGQGRSYGDVCLNDGSTLLKTQNLNHFISLNRETGLLKCESGVTLEKILQVIVPQGWFLPVSPGTKYVSMGGAIANDIHGKNHHRAGTFGHHIKDFTLLRSDRGLIHCSPQENSDLFFATIGGLGLTGLIIDATLQLKKITGPLIDQETIPFESIDDFFPIAEESDKNFEYTVAWIDTLSTKSNLGRGIFMRGNHSAQKSKKYSQRKISVPFFLPSLTLNPLTLKSFNHLYFEMGKNKPRHQTIHYEPFFYPLDSVLHWNRIYGHRGFFQFQCVLPTTSNPEEAKKLLKKMLTRGAETSNGSFLAVLKKFGSHTPAGLLSFPKEGWTLALDFPNTGAKIRQHMEWMEDLVSHFGGRLYPAKDACMKKETFQKSYPDWEKLEKIRDPQFSSSFWRRVT